MSWLNSLGNFILSLDKDIQHIRKEANLISSGEASTRNYLLHQMTEQSFHLRMGGLPFEGFAKIPVSEALINQVEQAREKITDIYQGGAPKFVKDIQLHKVIFDQFINPVRDYYKENGADVLAHKMDELAKDINRTFNKDNCHSLN